MRSIIVTGFPRQAAYLTELLNRYGTKTRAVFHADTYAGLSRAAAHGTYADAAIAFGGPRPNAIVQKICEVRRRPAIVLWAGTDVLQIAKTPRQLEWLRLERLEHWAVAPHLADELRSLGVEARCVPVASSASPKVLAALPPRFTVLAQLPVPRRAFYGQACLWEAARRMPDARFVVVGNGDGEPDAPKNVEYYGDVSDIDAYIDGACVLLRVPEHDGLSVMVIEAMARGRHVVWSYPYPGVLHARSQNDAVDALLRLHDAHQARALPLNDAGLRCVAQKHDPAKIAAGIDDALDEAIEQAQRAYERRHARHLVISGQEVFSARVTANCRAYSEQFSATVLKTASTADLVVSALELLGADTWYSIGEPAGPRVLEVAARLSRRRRLLHWLGDDVDRLAGNPQLRRQCRSHRYEHLAQNDDIADRLLGLGIHSRVVPVAAVCQAGEVQPMPAHVTLLLYVPHERPEFYGWYQYERLMRSLGGQDIRYIIVGGGPIDVPAGVQAEQLGWCTDLRPIYDRTTALVRFTQAGPVSTMVVEALLHGRYVLCSEEFPFCFRLRDYRDLENHVTFLLRRHAEGRLAPQYDACAAMRSLYDPQRCVHLLEEHVDCAAPPQSVRTIVQETGETM